MIVLQTIVEALSIPQNDVLRIAKTAPHRYKVYSVDKRSGTGKRTIAQPSRELKAIQKCLIHEVLCDLPVHSAATAYSKGDSIRNNASQHVTNNYLLKMDFSDFFPSIKPRDLIQHIMAHSEQNFDRNDLDLILRILFWSPKRSRDLVLSIGAPSSPFISNSIMYNFDILLSDECAKQGIIYTRYADDIALSCNKQNILADMRNYIIHTAESIKYPRLQINHKKTVFTSKKHHRAVTGIVLSSQGTLSLGRERKRLIRSMINKFKNNTLMENDCSRLHGLLAFALDVEPSFYDRMTKKYGNDTLDSIRKYELISNTE